MSTEQAVRAVQPPSHDAAQTAPFDLVAFGLAVGRGDLGYQLARYAPDADIRITSDTPSTPTRFVSGTQAISVWLHEAASSDPTPTVSHLVDGGDRVAFTQHRREPDRTIAVLISTAELQNGLITTQHTIIVRSRAPGTSESDGWAAVSGTHPG